MSFMLLGILNAQAAGGGGGGAFDLLETTTLTGTQNNISFTGLGSLTDYSHLQIRMVGRLSSNYTGDGFTNIIFNGEGSTNDYGHLLMGNGSSVTSNTNANMIPYWAPLNLEDSGAYMALVLDVLDFSSTTKATTARALWGNSTTNSKRVGLSSGGMFLTDAITTINCWSNGGGWVAGSRFSLYGIKGA
jgi:hypothetical protein